MTLNKEPDIVLFRFSYSYQKIVLQKFHRLDFSAFPFFPVQYLKHVPELLLAVRLHGNCIILEETYLFYRQADNQTEFRNG